MLQIIKKIFNFAGKKRELLKKAVLTAFVGAIFGALQFAALMIVLDAVIAKEYTVAVIFGALGIMLLSIIGRLICMYHSTNAETEVGYFMVAQKRIEIGDRLRYIPMGYFNKNSLGAITGVVTTTLGDVENSAARCLVTLFGGFLNTFALCLMLFIVDWRLGLLSLTGIAVYLSATEISTRKSKATGPARQKAQEQLSESVLEYVQGMSVVKAYGLEKDNRQTVQKTIEESCNKALKLEYTVLPWSGIRQGVVWIFSLLIGICSVMFYFQGSMPLSRCILMLIASFMIYRELENAGNMSDLLQMLGASIDTANAIDGIPIMDEKGAELAPQDASVTFKDVEFSYEERKILDHINIEIKPQTTTAIVGPSGSGKTTLCHLIARFWDVQGGQILVGGHPVQEYKLDSLMKNISMVFQNVYLFQDTIENNIKFGRPDATREEVEAAAKRACCHEFIMALPDGYDTVVGEAGGTLSGGERQRISIARALLKDAPVLVLDDCTSALDFETEKKIFRNIKDFCGDKTLLIASHRANALKDMDEILFFENGKIVERGTHEELMKLNGRYAEIYNHQAGQEVLE